MKVVPFAEMEKIKEIMFQADKSQIFDFSSYILKTFYFEIIIDAYKISKMVPHISLWKVKLEVLT
jgi:hypothetical protein